MSGPMTRAELQATRASVENMADVVRTLPPGPQRDRDLDRLQAMEAQLDVWLEQAE